MQKSFTFNQLQAAALNKRSADPVANLSFYLPTCFSLLARLGSLALLASSCLLARATTALLDSKQGR